MKFIDYSYNLDNFEIDLVSFWTFSKKKILLARIRYSVIRRCFSRSRPVSVSNFLLVNRSASATILVCTYTNTRGQTANTRRAWTCITTVVVTYVARAGMTTSTGRGCTRTMQMVCRRVYIEAHRQPGCG